MFFFSRVFLFFCSIEFSFIFWGFRFFFSFLLFICFSRVLVLFFKCFLYCTFGLSKSVPFGIIQSLYI